MINTKSEEEKLFRKLNTRLQRKFVSVIEYAENKLTRDLKEIMSDECNCSWKCE